MSRYTDVMERAKTEYFQDSVLLKLSLGDNREIMVRVGHETFDDYWWVAHYTDGEETSFIGQDKCRGFAYEEAMASACIQVRNLVTDWLDDICTVAEDACY